jgi:hypothetical protein
MSKLALKVTGRHGLSFTIDPDIVTGTEESEQPGWSFLKLKGRETALLVYGTPDQINAAIAKIPKGGKPG